MTSGQKVIGILGTGGTISCLGTDPYDALEYADTGHVLDISELVQRFPDVSDAIETIPISFRAVKSNEMDPTIWLELRGRITALLAEEPRLDGIVLTHGTASLEETAYFLHLTLAAEVPIVVVGAQRPSTAYGSDAPTNYMAAVRVAASPDSDGHGVTVVLNDQISSPREVSKTSNHRLETFRSREYGPLGHVEPDGHVHYYRASTRLHTFGSRFAQPGALEGVTELPRVDVVYSYAGCDGWSIDASVAAGSRGIVLAGLAPGLNPPAQDAAVQRARDAGVVVVQGSRAGEGRVLPRRSFGERGLVAADNLTPQAARVLLSLSLLETADPIVIQEIFDSH
jgi:L-asparaginase